MCCRAFRKAKSPSRWCSIGWRGPKVGCRQIFLDGQHMSTLALRPAEPTERLSEAFVTAFRARIVGHQSRDPTGPKTTSPDEYGRTSKQILTANESSFRWSP